MERTNPGGTWIGVTKNGRMAVITNTSSATADPTLQSRGRYHVLIVVLYIPKQRFGIGFDNNIFHIYIKYL